VREPVADKVVGRLEYEGGRIAGLVLAGARKQRTFIFGVYGFAGSSTNNQPARSQRCLWSQLGSLLEVHCKKHQEPHHHMVVLGDFNVLPSTTFSTSRKALPSSVEDLLSWQTKAGLCNVLLQGSPEASLSRGFFTRKSQVRRCSGTLPPGPHHVVTGIIMRGGHPHSTCGRSGSHKPSWRPRRGHGRSQSRIPTGSVSRQTTWG
jgi:hypothetical protein